MKPLNYVSLLTEPKSWGSCLCIFIPSASLFCLAFFIGITFIAPNQKEMLYRWGTLTGLPTAENKKCEWGMPASLSTPKNKTCENQSRPSGAESLPEGIVAKTSNLQMRPLWGFPESDNSSTNLFAIAVGIKQRDLVDKMVKKFLSSDFIVMLFHYDGIIDQWKEFEWSNRVIHVSAYNQTKWWFAKRFLHPDIVAEYGYIFLWDEDLGVEDFHPDRYVSIVKSEGLEISQPGLDPSKSEVHHQITARWRKSIVHRRTFKSGVSGKGGCDASSMAPPCTGWIEMMAPVFSRAAWRCVWYMIQNDLIHAWGLDTQLGYCAQGDRIRNVGVVDAEYIVHHGRPTLGEGKEKGAHRPHNKDPRVEVRRQSYIELDIFKKRWAKAVEEDKCWFDLYPQ